LHVGCFVRQYLYTEIQIIIAMATTKKAPKAKTRLIDDTEIISLYMNDVLEHNDQPANVYLFCKRNQIEEPDFYTFFNSIDALKQEIWVKFFENARTTIHADSNYASYSGKNKLLSLYFTLFEILTLNRTYVMYSLKDNQQGLRNLKDLKQFRNHFKDFIVSVFRPDTASEIHGKVAKVTEPVISEGAWLQFLFILKFWMDDTSKGFEKTDIIIEKSVNTVVDMLDTKPLENLIDLGKFLWKERKM
jgi:tetracycline repressor-like protein